MVANTSIQHICCRHNNRSLCDHNHDHDDFRVYKYMYLSKLLFYSQSNEANLLAQIGWWGGNSQCQIDIFFIALIQSRNVKVIQLNQVETEIPWFTSQSFTFSDVALTLLPPKAKHIRTNLVAKSNKEKIIIDHFYSHFVTINTHVLNIFYLKLLISNSKKCSHPFKVIFIYPARDVKMVSSDWWSRYTSHQSAATAMN